MKTLMQRTHIRASEMLRELAALLFSGVSEEAPARNESKRESTHNRKNQISDELRNFAQSQLVEAARHGLATTEVLLTEQQILEVFPRESVEEFDSVAYSEDDVEWPEDDEVPGPGYYGIDIQYWQELDPNWIDWSTSLIRIPVRYINLRAKNKGDVYRLKEIENTYVENAPLCFVDPDTILSKVTEIPPAPTPATLRRYHSTQRYFWAELIAVAWRFLAIEKPPADRGLNATLIMHLRHYIAIQGLYDLEDAQGPTDSMLKTVVGQIINQWQCAETDATVLVSPSARTMPRRPPIG